MNLIDMSIISFRKLYVSKSEPQFISFYGLVGGAQKGWQSVTVLLLYARYAAHRSWIPGFRSASRNGSPGCGEPHAGRTLLLFFPMRGYSLRRAGAAVSDCTMRAAACLLTGARKS